MPRYNLAYSPSDKIFAETCIVFAATHFADLADGYCLNRSSAFPHVTLSQFEASEAQLTSVWHDAVELGTESLEIAFHGVDLRPGTGTHAGYVWAELLAQREPKLVACQTDIVEMLESMGLQSLTQSDQYSPHLTLARLTKVPQGETPSWPDKAGLKRRHPFHLTLGLANDNGVYLQTLQPR